MADEVRKASEIAVEILEFEAWFNALPAAMKDELSQPNFNHHQAKRAVELARAVQEEGTQ